MAQVVNVKTATRGKNTVYIGRGSPWGNPYKIGQHGNREQVIALFEKHTLPYLDLSALVGKDLACYCAPQRCHGHSILKEIARRAEQAKPCYRKAEEFTTREERLAESYESAYVVNDETGEWSLAVA